MSKKLYEESSIQDIATAIRKKKQHYRRQHAHNTNICS